MGAARTVGRAGTTGGTATILICLSAVLDVVVARGDDATFLSAYGADAISVRGTRLAVIAGSAASPTVNVGFRPILEVVETRWGNALASLAVLRRTLVIRYALWFLRAPISGRTGVGATVVRHQVVRCLRRCALGSARDAEGDGGDREGAHTVCSKQSRQRAPFGRVKA